MAGTIAAALLGLARDALPGFLACAAVITALEALDRRKRNGAAWWRKPGLALDLAHYACFQVVSRAATLLWLGLGLVVLELLAGRDAAGIVGGGGPWLLLPFWLQVAAYVVLFELGTYWTHRLLHGRELWRFHAVHHSSTSVDWTSAYRWHPVDISLHTVAVAALLALSGAPFAVLAVLGPFHVLMSAVVHADLEWTYGWAGRILVSPVHHRWHHSDEAGLRPCNFATFLSLTDVLFGTYHAAPDRRPASFGNGDPAFPQTFVSQMAHPFSRAARADAGADG